MKVINVPYKNESGYDHGESSEFSSWDLEKLQEKGVSIVIYSYAQGSYEGSGNAIVKAENGWHAFGCGHCSCYGPCDEENLRLEGEGHKTLAALKKSFSPEYLKEVQPLLDAAEENKIK